jgi:two-component system, chemotaxis family, CheB/CheR fusion protein
MTEQAASRQTSPLVVGIGASAGGLDSLDRFFRGLPAQPGVVIVIVQHLSPNHESLMEELLQRFTALTVHRAEDGLEIEANHVYVLPPGKEITLSDRRLRVTDRPGERVLSFPIDRFFTSLAEECGRRAVAVVLSGGGTDGSRGVRSIHEAGGLVLVEDPAGAAFESMPRSAIETGTTDAVLSPEEIARALIDHASSGDLPDGDTAPLVDQIIELLRQHRGIELADYKPGTIYRRMMRRVDAQRIDSLARYLEILSRDRRELEALHDDLFIGVTAFFRDPQVFTALEEQLAALAASPIEPQRPLRIWVAGCATGEEAYSFAILCDEVLSKASPRRAYKIFATDAHRKVLEKATAGIYARDQLKNVSAERLHRFFVPTSDGGYKVADHIRHAVVFAAHNVLADTPFTNLDIVSCRNLLIYFRPKAQRHALASLAYGLRIGGILVLGSSEHPAEFAQYFEPVNEMSRIYRKRGQAPIMRRTELATRAVMPPRDDWRRREHTLLPTYDALLDKFMPAGFLVTGQRRLVDSYAGADTLLHISPRRPSLDFLELVPPAVRTPVTSALARAQRQSGPAVYPAISWPLADGSQRDYQITAERLQVRTDEPLYLLTLTEVARASSASDASIAAPNAGDRVCELERDLADARQSLQSTVEELEASNEELQATNEELQSSNEELQTVNEELHSVNEELHTVNAEHQVKISELTELNRDVGHLLESIDVATIFLDNELRIRKFTPRAHELFGLVEHDIGRLLATFNHRLRYPGFIDDISKVHREGSRVETEVADDRGSWFFVRILPYRTGGDVNGVVVTLTDATALATERVRARQLSAIVDSSADAIIGQTLDGTITSWNLGATRLYGYTADEMIGQSIMRLVPEAEQPAMLRWLADVAQGGDVVNVSVIRVSKTGEPLDIGKTMSPVRDARGTVVGIATIDRDTRLQKDMDRRLRESERKYADLYNNAPDLYLSVDARSGRILEHNDTFTRFTGYSPEETLGMYLSDLCTGETRPVVRDILEEIRAGRMVVNRPLCITRRDAHPLHVTLSATPMFDIDGTVARSRTVLRDVSETRLAEQQLQQAAVMREQFLAMASHELRSPLHAIMSALQVIDAAGSSDERRQQSQAIVRRQTRQMVRLVDDLLDVSRILHGKLALERAPLDLTKTVRDALDGVSAAYHAKGVRLMADGLERPIPMYGDAGRLGQVLTNLLENALRATEPLRSVRVRATRIDGQRAELEIIDEGRGIDPAKIDDIFGMFAQAAQGLARSEGGLGLGLTIAARIVSAHGGTLRAHSDGLGKGATFAVTLPVDLSIELTAQASMTRPERFSILVVEDQADAREMIVTVLSLAGHDVFGAAEGQEALDLLQSKRPTLALIDIGLPGMNGYEVASEVRRLSGEAVRLVALSGYGQPDDIRRAEAAGFDRHVTKPVDPDRLVQIMREVVFSSDGQPRADL